METRPAPTASALAWMLSGATAITVRSGGATCSTRNVSAPVELASKSPSVAPAGTDAMNMAFDVTPHELVTSIITEDGVLEPPYEEAIARAVGR